MFKEHFTAFTLLLSKGSIEYILQADSQTDSQTGDQAAQSVYECTGVNQLPERWMRVAAKLDLGRMTDRLSVSLWRINCCSDSDSALSQMITDASHRPLNEPSSLFHTAPLSQLTRGGLIWMMWPYNCTSLINFLLLFRFNLHSPSCIRINTHADWWKLH